ncbi:MAG: 30S ribosomal protein S7, partial [Chloroflexota bacterium]
MPRKGPAPKRQLPPDPVYNSTMVTRFINRML